MRQDNFIKKIRLEYQCLTKAEKKVADFVLKNAQKALFMSITDLAAACKVGETTVFRFCKSMKLQGYQEFRIQLSLSMQNEEENSEQEVLNGNIGREDSLVVIAQKLLNSNIDVLTETKELFEKEKISQLVERMIKAEHIFFLGWEQVRLWQWRLPINFCAYRIKYIALLIHICRRWQHQCFNRRM